MTEANRLYGEYLEHSCRYYILDQPVIRDSEFDSICKELLERWNEVTHRYKSLTDKSALIAGTGFQMAFTMPYQIVDLCRRVSPNMRLRDYFK